MEKVIIGKYLIKKATLKNGEVVLTLTGVFHPKNFNIDEINDNDEMWVSGLITTNGLKFTNPFNSVSPEDFLSGENQSPKDWKNKSVL
jgi:hypothetical protein